MKDRRGVMRGKCNQCDECEEYMSPSEGARCDYCGHVPTQHVEMIDLGPCKCGECDEYMSDEKFSYTDCLYCGCKATQHKGADKLKKNQSSTSTVPPKGTAPDHPDSASSRLPTSDSNNGPMMCKFPGCDKPCFIEGGKRHDFCGKTHAMKYKEQAFTMPSYGKPTPLVSPVPKPHPSPSNTTSSDQQPPPPYSSIISADNPQIQLPPRNPSTQLPPGNPPTQLPPGNPPTQLPPGNPLTQLPPGNPLTQLPPGNPPTQLPKTFIPPPANATTNGDKVKQSNIPSTTAGNKTVKGGGQSSPGVKMCYDCRKQPANPGYNICEGCYKHRTT